MTYEQRKELAVLAAFSALSVTLLLTNCFFGAGIVIFFMMMHYL